MEENRLIEKSKQGDEEAFGLLVQKYKTKVFNLAYSFTRDRETADDLAQEVFIKVYYALERFKFQSGLGTWLYRIAVNHFKDYLRKHAKERHVSIDALGREISSSLSEDEIKKKEKAQEAADRKKLLHQALQSLPEKYQVILTLRDIQGHSYEEIAGFLKLSAGTVDSRLHRARKMLRKKIAPFLSQEGGNHEM
ncbi:MAG: sigma-70 family RNA polymerase sigma factor [Candidatus Aminicenantes bacterium]|nr:MAG: sigma-70 family RNA polymerase sigma factor [Candidatus Aminicenantes bacterium]